MVLFRCILCLSLKGLQVIVMCIPSLFQASDVTSLFTSKLQRNNWVLTTHDFYYASYGDLVDDKCTVIYGVHASTASIVSRMNPASTPILRPKPISNFLHEEFNDSNFAVCFGRQYIDQYSENKMMARDPMPTPLYLQRRIFC